MDYTEVQDENEIDDIEHIKYIEVDTPKKKKPKKRKTAIAKRSMGKNSCSFERGNIVYI